MAGRNIDIVLTGLVDAIRSQDPGRIADLLAPDLVWEGLRPERAGFNGIPGDRETVWQMYHVFTLRWEGHPVARLPGSCRRPGRRGSA